MNVFVLSPKDYKRDLNLIKHYINDQAFYLHKMTGEDLDTCVSFVKSNISPNGRRAMKIPGVGLLERNRQQDRQKVTKPLLSLLQEVQNERLTLTPSLTAYCPPDQEKSSLANYVVANLNARNELKKKKFEAVMAGDNDLADIFESGQTTKKIKNNALSGAQCSPFTILWNKTAHSSLTSTCRTATGYGNANNERFIMGNRHYYTPDIALNNLVSLITHTDLDKAKRIIDDYSLHYPEVKDVMEMVIRSTNHYWRSPPHLDTIEDFIKRLSPVERAVVLYTNNLFDLAKVNPVWVYSFISELSTPVDQPGNLDSLKHMDDDLKAYVCMLFGDKMAGRSYTVVKEEDPEILGLIAGQIEKVLDIIDTYTAFIKMFWTTPHLPPSIYAMPTMVRKTVIVSDTDSTIFTVSHWVNELIQYRSTLNPDAIANSIVFLCGQTVRNIMATLSANIGVDESEIFRLVMKNEYYFPTFSLTGRAKHYYAHRSAQEGNVFKEPQLEIKGVGLRNSNLPLEFNDGAKEIMKDVLTKSRQNGHIELTPILKTIAQKEMDTIKRIKAGDYNILKSIQIKDKSAYKEGSHTGNYFHYELWENAFAIKYGSAPTPPYRAVKLSLTTTSTVKLNAWLDEMKDINLSKRIRDMISSTVRKNLSTVYLPEDIINQKGLPAEIIGVLDVRSMISQLMEPYYMVLDSLGYPIKNDNNTRLVMDEII